MSKQKHLRSYLYRVRTLLASASVLVLIGGAAVVHADQFDVQINALQQKNNAAQGVLNGLASQADSYEAVIGKLKAQVGAIQSRIDDNKRDQSVLQQKIDKAQAEITLQKTYLGQDIRSMYVDGQLSTIEELATSKSLSDYVDKEEYRIAAQDKLNQTIKDIADLQAQLQREKTQLDNLIASQQQQQDQLADTQAEKQKLLSYNEGQQAAFNHQIASNSSKIAELRRQQAILNSRYNIGDFHGSAGNGGYPNTWAYAPQDSMLDSWGMYNRECVSYTAFKVHQDFLAGRNSRDMPYWGGRGNANQWDDNARAAGIPVNGTPSVGSIAVSNSGFYGHVMYVAGVNGNQIYVQQYNASLTGQYSEGWRYTTGLVFIHF